jgi:hypothetical protein
VLRNSFQPFFSRVIMQMQYKLAIVAAAAAALVACGKKEEAQPAATSQGPAVEQLVVKIGHVGPTSGPIAHLGKDNENGARMAIEELNAAGIQIEASRSSSSCWPKTMRRIRSKARRRPRSWSMPKSTA